MSELVPLNNWQREVVNYIEYVHATTGAVPTDDDIIEYLTLDRKFSVNSESLRLLKETESFKKSLESRGLSTTPGITSRQMAAASLMLNLTDRRSDEKKLRDLGISTEEYTNWMQSREFSAYMRDRAEALISNSVHEAHMGLLRGVKQGNTSAIQLYYKMTGRYDPDKETQINVRLVIGRVLEAIQKHVRDPEILNQLAVELSQIALEPTTQTVKGEIL